MKHVKTLNGGETNQQTGGNMQYINNNLLNKNQKEYLIPIGFFVSFLIFVLILMLMKTNPSTLISVLFPALLVTLITTSLLAYITLSMDKTANRKENFKLIWILSFLIICGPLGIIMGTGVLINAILQLNIAIEISFFTYIALFFIMVLFKQK